MPRPNPFLLITMLFWGFNFVSMKIVFPVMAPAAVVFWRYFLMGGVLIGLCLLTRQSLRIPGEHRNAILMTGFCSMGIYMVLFFEGVKRAPAGESAIILATNPIMVGVMSMVLGREPKSLARVLGSVVALTGVALVVLGRPGALVVSKETQDRLIGDLLLFLSAISWAASVILAKPVSTHIKPLPLFTMSMLGGLPVVLIYGWSAATSTQWSSFTAWHWINLAQIAFGSGVIAMVFYYKGVADLPASVASLHQFLVPVLTTLFAALLLRESLAWVQAIGVLVLLVGLSVNVGLIRTNKKSGSGDQNPEPLRS
jgi:drug/metabolite transporter (DMT)-like permease